jgi:hypothetical protein
VGTPLKSAKCHDGELTGQLGIVSRFWGWFDSDGGRILSRRAPFASARANFPKAVDLSRPVGDAREVLCGFPSSDA